MSASWTPINRILGDFRLPAIVPAFSISSYINGVLILLCSMLALYASLKLGIHQEKFVTFYKEASTDILVLSDKFEGFESAVMAHLDSPAAENHDVIQQNLEELTTEFLVISEKIEGSNSVLVSQKFKQGMRSITAGLRGMNKIAQEMKNFPEKVQEREYAVKIVYDLAIFHDDIHRLWGILFDDYQTNGYAHSAGVWSVRVYWGVCILGLMGFLLIILDADKLRRLRALNKDKDITLSLLQQRLMAMESCFDGIGIIDRDENIVYMNPAMMNLHALTPEKAHGFIGRPWTTLFSKEAMGLIEDNLLPAVRAKRLWYGEADIMRHDNSVARVEISLTPLPDGGMIGTSRDVTERRYEEMEKNKLQEQFFQAQKMEALGRLAGGIAHDFNNLLGAIRGYAEFIADDIPPDQSQHLFAKNILEAVRQATSLVEQILSFSKRKQKPQEIFDLCGTLRECISILWSSVPRGIDLQTAGFEEGHIEQIVGTESQISQLVMNLCVNALDAMESERGTLTLTLDRHNPPPSSFEYEADAQASLRPDFVPLRIEDIQPRGTRVYLGRITSQHEYICLRISDTGTGMPRAVMERMFEPFFTTKAIDKGTGLGLSTAHGIISAHNGAMIVESVPGQGTLFEIYLPVSTQAAMAAQKSEAQKPKAKMPARLLLVEDAVDVRHMTRVMLERLGHSVTDAKDGQEALLLLRLRRSDFDLVITDHNMPHLTGLELVQAAHQEFPGLPFIMMTGYADHELERERERLPGIRAIFKKPVDRQKILETIDLVVAGQRKN